MKLLLISIVFVCTTIHAQAEDDLTRLYNQKITAAKIPGIQMVFKQNGNVLFENSLGFSNISSKSPMTNTTRFYSASMTKMFTAMAIFQLSERGRINLHERAVKYAPWLALHQDPQAQRITIAQLMSHTSGMSRNANEFWNRLDRLNKGIVPTENELVKAVLTQTFGVKEGTRLKYSNTGFEFLGYIIGTVCDQCSGHNKIERYTDYVQRNILTPLGMANSGFTPTQLGQFAVPYGRVDAHGGRGVFNVLPGTGASAAAWGLYSSAHDMMLFLEELSKVIFRQPNKLVRRDFSKMISNPVAWDLLNPGIGHSYGFRILRTNQGLLVGHTGGFPGYSSAAFISMNDRAMGVTYLNATDANGLSYLMDAFKVQSNKSLVTLPSQLPAEPLPEPIPGNKFQVIVGKYDIIYGTLDIIYENDRYFILFSGQKVPITLNVSMDGRVVEGRIGRNAGYLDWIGDSIKFYRGPNGKTIFLASNSIWAYHQ